MSERLDELNAVLWKERALHLESLLAEYDEELRDVMNMARKGITQVNYALQSTLRLIEEYADYELNSDSNRGRPKESLERLRYDAREIMIHGHVRRTSPQPDYRAYSDPFWNRSPSQRGLTFTSVV